MSDDDKPTDLKVVKFNVPASEMKKELAQMRRSLPDLIEFQKLQSEMWFAHFKSLREAGFAPAEALELCSK